MENFNSEISLNLFHRWANACLKEFRVGNRTYYLNSTRETTVSEAVRPDDFSIAFPDYLYSVKRIFKFAAALSEIKENGGIISPSMYIKHKGAINAAARQVSNQRWHCGGDSLCEYDDEQALPPPESALKLEDKHYGEDIGINILGNNQEGARFLQNYDSNRNLISLRIFNQGHRSAIKVTTTNAQDIIQKIDEISENAKEAERLKQLSVPSLEDMAIHFVEPFNQSMPANIMRMNIYGCHQYNCAVGFEFTQSPTELADHLYPLHSFSHVYKGTNRLSLWTEKSQVIDIMQGREPFNLSSPTTWFYAPDEKYQSVVFDVPHNRSLTMPVITKYIESIYK